MAVFLSTVDPCPVRRSSRFLWSPPSHWQCLAPSSSSAWPGTGCPPAWGGGARQWLWVLTQRRARMLSVKAWIITLNSSNSFFLRLDSRLNSLACPITWQNISHGTWEQLSFFLVSPPSFHCRQTWWMLEINHLKKRTFNNFWEENIEINIL